MMTFNEYLELDKQIINESLSFRNIIGTKGPLSEKLLIDPRILFNDTFRKIDLIFKNNLHVDIASTFKDDIGYLIYLNYVKNMFGELPANINTDGPKYGYHAADKLKQFPKSARGFFGWINDIRNGKIRKITLMGRYPIMAFLQGDNYLFGHWITHMFKSYFIACYISSTSKIGLMNLVKELCQYDNVVFQVTLDIALSLKKLGFYTDDQIHIESYHGHNVDKMIFATSKPVLDKALEFDKKFHEYLQKK